MPIYSVAIETPAINEEVVVSADNAEQARERAVYSAAQRLASAAVVVVTEIPDDTPPRPRAA